MSFESAPNNDHTNKLSEALSHAGSREGDLRKAGMGLAALVAAGLAVAHHNEGRTDAASASVEHERMEALAEMQQQVATGQVTVAEAKSNVTEALVEAGIAPEAAALMAANVERALQEAAVHPRTDLASND